MDSNRLSLGSWAILFTVLGQFASIDCFSVVEEEKPSSAEAVPSSIKRCNTNISPNDGPQIIAPDTELLNGTTEVYKKNLACYWNVDAPEGHVIMLQSETFEVELSENCVWDYLEIHDVSGHEETTIRFCGWDNFEYLSKGNHLKITFKTDESFEDVGFKVKVTQLEATSDKSLICKNESRDMQQALVNRENVAQDCYFRLNAPEGQHIQLSVQMIQFDNSPCDEEALIIYKGASSSEKLQICADTPVSGAPVDIASGTVLIHYLNTDSEGERFELRYSFIDPVTTTPIPSTPPSPVGGHADCSKLIKEIDSEMVYEAPQYENNKECIVVVKNTKKNDHVVQIEFTDFEMENSTNCIFDSLRVLAGERSDSTELGGPYCGEMLKKRTLVTNGNVLRLEFKTDESFSLQGFTAKISFVEKASCNCRRNKDCVMNGFEKLCFGKSSCSDYCDNGGTCVQTKTSKSCYCPSGFTGETCEREVTSGKKFFGFEVAPKTKYTKKENAEFIECMADTPDEVDYIWTYQGEEILPYTKASGFGTDNTGALTGSILQIDKFDDQHEGDYVCMAKTSYGSAEHSFSLHLETPCDKAMIESMIGPTTQEVDVGEFVSLSCSTEPKVDTIRWKKDGRLIDLEQESRYKQLVTGNLLISNVELGDSGKYTCEAISEDLCSDERSGVLTVLFVEKHGEFCGRSIHDEAKIRGYIAKGYEVKPKQHPWYVRVVALKGKKTGTICGGSLISRKFVLTATHCIKELEKQNIKFDENNIRLHLGTNDCGGEDATVRRPVKVHIHDNYGTDYDFNNDIALLELDSPIEYPEDKSILPICLEPARYIDNKFLEEKRSINPTFGQAVGCGQTKSYGTKTSRNLLMINIPYISEDTCLETYDEKLDPNNMFCAGSSEKVKAGDVCSGDSGGPLIMADGNRWVQTGIVSFGKGCNKGYPSVFTHVGRYYDWINDITNFKEDKIVQ